MRIVCISDTHEKPPPIPDGDILIHAGDLTLQGRYFDVMQQCLWLSSLPHKHKILIAGNHDWVFQKDPAMGRVAVGAPHSGIIYLQDTGTIVEGLNIWGSPWQPEFCDWAFNLPRGGEKLRQVWSLIPEDTDILVTHGPPKHIMDGVRRTEVGDLRSGAVKIVRHPEGCEHLAARVKIVKPKLHVFGHIHEQYGIQQTPETIFVNAACGYHAEHKPIVVDYENGKFKVPDQR